jgi:hypothetical protein
MPKHWRPIAPDNPSTKDRIDKVRKIVEDDHKGKLKFCGYEEGTEKWWALVDVKTVSDPDKMWEDIRSLAPGKVLLDKDDF